VAEACRRAARPEAARTIARILGARLGLTEEKTALLILDQAEADRH
jgi:hypothetical protein